MKERNTEYPLLIAIGNSAREDDGLGWSFLERVEEFYPGECLYRFQLNMEDAEMVAEYASVIFIDATKEALEQGYAFRYCIPAADLSYSTHMLSPQSLLYLSKALYGQAPASAILAVQGYRWELKEGLSENALSNLERALKWFKEAIEKEQGKNMGGLLMTV